MLVLIISGISIVNWQSATFILRPAVSSSRAFWTVSAPRPPRLMTSGRREAKHDRIPCCRLAAAGRSPKRQSRCSGHGQLSEDPPERVPAGDRPMQPPNVQEVDLEEALQWLVDKVQQKRAQGP